MDNFTPAPCIADEGIKARIPDSPFSILTLIEARNRLSTSPDSRDATPEVLSNGLNLSLAQVYAALAYYHTNQAAFDAELTRRREAAEQALEMLFAEQADRKDWAEIIGKWPGDETDEQINIALERLS